MITVMINVMINVMITVMINVVIAFDVIVLVEVFYKLLHLYLLYLFDDPNNHQKYENENEVFLIS